MFETHLVNPSRPKSMLIGNNLTLRFLRAYSMTHSFSSINTEQVE